MPKISIPIDNGYYISDSLMLSNQKCTNWYPNTPQVQGALSTGNLFGCAGLSQIATTGITNQVNRGMHVKAGKPYFLNGEEGPRSHFVEFNGVVKITMANYYYDDLS